MINRILIRIKVIQILYSSLLVEKPFAIESLPTPPTKEKRFAYALYLDMLGLMCRLADKVKPTGNSTAVAPLSQTRFIQRLRDDEQFNALVPGLDTDLNYFPLYEALPDLMTKVRESAIFKRFLKDNDDAYGSGQAHLWHDIFQFIMMEDPALNNLFKKRENYTLKGVERMREMMLHTFTNFLTSHEDWASVKKMLDESLDKARELYFRLLALPIEITDLQERILDDARFKFIKTEEDVNPGLRFVENRLVAKLRENPEIKKYLEENRISWLQEEPLLLRSLLKSILESRIYQDYMLAPESSLESDVELWRNLFKSVILDNEDFLLALEEKSVFWNDDLDTMSDFAIKTFRRFAAPEPDPEADSEADPEETSPVYEKFKDEEDAKFGEELIKCVFADKEKYQRLIKHTLDSGKWESERLAFMDAVVIMTALAEIVHFPKIPLQVSVNEYIVIAKSYSSAKSGQFVNGVLASVIARLRAAGELNKK